jgi:hypothetical protein
MASELTFPDVDVHREQTRKPILFLVSKYCTINLQEFFFLAVPSDAMAHGLTPPDAAVHSEKTRKPEKKKKNYSRLIWSSDPLHVDWLGFFPSWPQGPISNPVIRFL